jgi:hypothetical protein
LRYNNIPALCFAIVRFKGKLTKAKTLIIIFVR